jgi:hypothetical protein
MLDLKKETVVKIQDASDVPGASAKALAPVPAEEM